MRENFKSRNIAQVGLQIVMREVLLACEDNKQNFGKVSDVATF
jgi:hypothetical protein